MSAFEVILTTTTLIAAALISPGPNNLIIMTAAAQYPWSGVIRTGMGILLGAICQFLLVGLGFISIETTINPMGSALMWGGAIYLAWMGIQGMVSAVKTGSKPLPNEVDSQNSSDRNVERKPLPHSFLGVFLFQFLYPNSWLLVVAVLSIWNVNKQQIAFFELVVVYSAIASGCLWLWAAVGRLAMGWLDSSRARQIFHGGIGLTLLVSALLLVIKAS